MKVLLAICGKSASGKDTLARELASAFPSAHLIVRDTTRPMRKNESQNIDYHFISLEEFNNIDYITMNVYRGWFYGTRKSELVDGLNIGVFSPNDLEQLKKLSSNDVQVVPIYLEVSSKVRYKRSKQRTGRVDFELLRRMYTDHKDFKDIDQLIRSFPVFVKSYENGCVCVRDRELRKTEYNLNASISQILEKSGII